MGAAKQTLARLIDQRARRRATQALINNHKEEFTELMAAYLIEAHEEADLIQARSEAHKRKADHEHEAAAPEPPRLQPGRRLEGQAAVDRIDVARCEVCIKSHDRGHACPRCGKVPQLDIAGKAREAHRLADAGTSVDVIAVTLRIPPDHVRRLLDLPAS